jgi:hypothetical protein
MQLFSWTLLEGEGSAWDWFLLHDDKSIKTIRDFLHDFLESLGMIRMRFTVSWLMTLWKNGRGKIFQI